MQPYKSLIIYIALIAILGSYIFFIAKQEKGTTEILQSEKNIFNDIPFSKITHATLTGPTGTFSFTKSNDRWRITSPIDAPADSPTIEMILSEIEFTQSKRSIPYEQINKPQETLQQWGILPPTFTFEFTAQDKTYTLHLGRKTAFSETYYAKTSNDPQAPILLVPSTLHAALNRKLDDLRDRTVFYDITQDKIQSIAFRSETPLNTAPRDFSLKLKDQKWTFERPFTARANSEKVKQFLDQITALNSVNFITDSPDNLDKFGLDTPTHEITLTTGDPATPYILLIGHPITEQSDLFYAKRLKDKAVFSITRENVNQLLTLIQSFRDLSIANFYPDHVTQITLEKGRQNLAFTRKESKWLIHLENKSLADHIKILNLLQRLQKTQANRVAKDAVTDLKPYGLNKPAAKITLTLQIPQSPPPPSQQKDTPPPPPPIQQTIEILFGKIDKDEIYLTTNLENTVYAFPKTLLDEINLDLNFWRSLTLFPLDSQQIKALKLTPKNQSEYTITRTSPSTFTTTLEDTTLDNFKTETLFVRAASLQAVKWLDMPQRIYQSPPAIIKILTEDDTLYTLTVANPLYNGNFPVLITPLNLQAEISYHDILSLLSVPTANPQTTVTTPPVQAPPLPNQP